MSEAFILVFILIGAQKSNKIKINIWKRAQQLFGSKVAGSNWRSERRARKLILIGFPPLIFLHLFFTYANGER